MKMFIPALLVSVLAAAGIAADRQDHKMTEAGSQELHESMTKSSQEMQSMEMSGNLDRDFVKTMLMHHRQGVEMAKIQVERGSDSKAKEFAKKMIANQTKEIRQLENWLSPQPGGKTDKR